ncbi:MAG TPA: GNAT family N-acetyltransferase [Jatrophihabitantaceae bacterium]
MIEIRRIGPDDWKMLRATRLAALQDAPEAFESTYEGSLAFGEDEWRRRAGTHPVFLAFVGEQPVGMAIGLFDEDTRPGSRDLVSMWVSPAVRGRGVAGRLIGAIAEWARAGGARELHLWVVVGNAAARGAYDRAGFVATGEQQPVHGAGSRIEERLVLALDELSV